MDKLAEVDADALRETLEEVESAKAAKRLVVALAYKDGVSVEQLRERYGIPRSTLYYWLDRFESRSIEDAIEDEPRPGRPAKLDADERERLQEHLGNPPSAFGYDAGEWTLELVRRHVEDAFGVTYSEGHVRRLLDSLEPFEE